MTLSNNHFLATTLFLLSLIVSGCSTRIADLTLVSTKNIDLMNTQLDSRQGRRQKGEDCKIVLLGIIPLGLPNLEEAVDKALEAGGGNIMVDQVTEFKETWFVVATQACMVVEGTVLNIPEVSPNR